MKRLFATLTIGMFIMGLAAVSFATSEMDEAKGMVESAIAFYKANGKEKALAEINNQKGRFVKGEVYVVTLDMTATLLAHPYNPKLVGKNMIDVPDPDGKMFRREQVELAKTKGSGWIDFKYKNPVTNKIEPKTAFIKKADDMIFVCGIYK